MAHVRHHIAAAIVAVGLYFQIGKVANSAEIWMSDADLKTAFSGKTIAGLYPNGRGFVETYHKGGRVVYRDQFRRVTGRWSVHANSFCTIYQGDASGGCYSVRQLSENCFEFYFISQSESERQRPGDPTWTAQAWISENPSTCVGGSEV